MVAGGDVEGCRVETFEHYLFADRDEAEACVAQLHEQTGGDYYVDCNIENVSDGMPAIVMVTTYCKVIRGR